MSVKCHWLSPEAVSLLVLATVWYQVLPSTVGSQEFGGSPWFDGYPRDTPHTGEWTELCM